MNPIFPVPAHRCPQCKAPIDGAEKITNHNPGGPNPDRAIGVCGDCGAMLRFNADMQMVLVSDVELLALMLLQPRAVHMAMRISKTIRQINSARNN